MFVTQQISQWLLFPKYFVIHFMIISLPMHTLSIGHYNSKSIRLKLILGQRIERISYILYSNVI